MPDENRHRLEQAAKYWFLAACRFESRHMKHIKEQFLSFDQARQCSPDAWKRQGWNDQMTARLAAASSSEPEPLQLLDRMEAKGIGMICSDDSDYPPWLKSTTNYPFALFYLGRRDLLDCACVAVVGARQATHYGRSMASQLARGLSRAGLTVVSGMARGIDAEAHIGALQGPASTIAVLGSGPDIIYPAENRRLYAQIRAEGLIVSEYPPGTRAYPTHFPARNRIISGLSRAVIVVEARSRSGALITADFALEQGRDVFAVPGPVHSPLSEGTHQLIRQGAGIVCKVEDILEDLSFSAPPCVTSNLELSEPGLPFEDYIPAQDLDEFEKKVVEWLQKGRKNVDEILAISGWEIGKLAAVLLQLEIKGLVKSQPGNYYIMSMDHYC